MLYGSRRVWLAVNQAIIEYYYNNNYYVVERKHSSYIREPHLASEVYTQTTTLHFHCNCKRTVSQSCTPATYYSIASRDQRPSGRTRLTKAMAILNLQHSSKLLDKLKQACYDRMWTNFRIGIDDHTDSVALDARV